jgi:hypothetical protein
MRNKNILICLPYFQKNRSSYYSFLINEVFKTLKVTLLAFTFDTDFVTDYRIIFSIIGRKTRNQDVFIVLATI